MGSITRIALLAIVGMLMGQHRVSEACTCAPEHPQTKFCQADFVILVRSKQVVEVNAYENAYKVKIHRIFKSTPKAWHALTRKPFWLWSPSSSSLCAPEGLTPNSTWLVSGRMIDDKPSTSLCSISKLWFDVSHRERNNFRHFYYRGCGCPIRFTPWHRKGAVFESTGGKSCLWESSPGPQDCQERFGVCTVNQGVCNWQPSLAYNKCIVKHQLKKKITDPSHNLYRSPIHK